MNTDQLVIDYPRIINKLSADFWVIESSAYDSLWAALQNHDAHAPMLQAALRPQELSQELVMTPQRGYRGARINAPGSGIGIVDVSGVIGKRISSLESLCGGVDVNNITAAVNDLVADPAIGTIIMNWHSPGGVITGIPEAYDELVAAAKQKTLISYTDTQQCSGAEWLASAADSKYCSNTAQVGSIGVYNMTLDRTGELAQKGIRVDAISAGKFKLMGAPFRTLTPEERGMLQERATNIHTDFKAAVTAGRKVDPAVLEGQTLTGKQALAAGLVDGIYPSLASLVKALVDRQK